MAFPLMALGAGLGNFAEQYRQQQESSLRQMAAKQQLEHLMQSQRAEELLGSVVRQGGQIPGFGNQSPFGLPQQAAAASPMGAPQMPPVPLGMMRTPMGQTVPRGDYLTPEEDTGPATPGPAMSVAPGAVVNGAIPLDSDAPSASPSMPPPIDPRAAGAESGLPVGVPASDAAAAPAQQDHTAPISSPGEFSQYLGMFHATSPTEIAAHINKVRPDASDGDVWRATATLMKMTSGNMKEQLAAASMMKFLMGDQTRRQIAGQTSADRASTRESRERLATGVGAGGAPTVAAGQLEARKQGQAATQQRSETREKRLTAVIDEKRAERAIARATGDTKMALQSLLSQSRQLKSQIDGIDMGMDAQKPERKAQRAKLQAQMDALGQKIEARTQAIEKATPVPDDPVWGPTRRD